MKRSVALVLLLAAVSTAGALDPTTLAPIKMAAKPKK